MISSKESSKKDFFFLFFKKDFLDFHVEELHVKQHRTVWFCVTFPDSEDCVTFSDMTV